MKRFLLNILLPVLAVTMLLSETASAQWGYYSWWGGYRPAYYSSYYTPAYATYYAPSYYTASYVPSTSYYVGSSYGSCSSCSSCSSCCSSGSCGTQCCSYVPATCCSPCTSCASCGGSGCADCCAGGCNLASSNSASPASNSNPTPVTPRADSAGSQGRNRTFLEEEDSGTGGQYENSPENNETGDGFSPRKSPDPLDQNLGVPNAGGEGLQFKIPEIVLNHREPAPTHARQATFSVKQTQPAEYPVLNLDEKITSRSVPQPRTRLMERRSWEQPAIATNVTRQAPVDNQGWVPLPAPTQVVLK